MLKDNVLITQPFTSILLVLVLAFNNRLIFTSMILWYVVLSYELLRLSTRTFYI